MQSLIRSKVIVTGGLGFLGSHVCDVLGQRGAYCFPLVHEKYDLINISNAFRFFQRVSPDYVIHCAGHNGGIEFNRLFPADILYQNAVMGLNIHKLCVDTGVKKLVNIMTSCAYPDVGFEVLKESNFWDGLPNESIRSHGIAKRILQTSSEAYNKQYGLKSISLCVTNLFGERDTFDLTRTKVVGALIRKFVEAYQKDQPYVECWGTGKPKREFMYVKDAAEAIVQALEQYEDSYSHLNIGTGSDITIKELVEKVAKAVEYTGDIKWLTEKGDGQMKKLLDVTKMNSILDVKLTNFEIALQNTIQWYINNKQLADKRK